jgi:rubrerythrin
MTLQEAIAVAIDFEVKVRDHYLQGAAAVKDEGGKKFFETLAKEEQGHVSFLAHALSEWKRTGKVPKAPIPSVLPQGVDWIEGAKKRVKDMPFVREASEHELEHIKAALALEQEATSFYRHLVSQLPEKDRPLFEGFLSGEDGHLALVQAQLNSVQGLGVYFDMMEFSLEAG